MDYLKTYNKTYNNQAYSITPFIDNLQEVIY